MNERTKERTNERTNEPFLHVYTNRSITLGLDIYFSTRRDNTRISRRRTSAAAAAVAVAEAPAALARRTAPASAPWARISYVDRTARGVHTLLVSHRSQTVDRRASIVERAFRATFAAKVGHFAKSRLAHAPDTRTPADTGSVRANNIRGRWTRVRRTSRARTRPRTGRRRCPVARKASPRAGHPRARPSRT